MSDPSDIDKVKQDLRNGLAEDLVAGYPEDRCYVPRNRLQDRVTRFTIRRCLPDARGELLDFIASKAQRVFAILVYSSGLPIGTSLKSAMQRCQDRGLIDNVLPLPRRLERCTCRGDRALCLHKIAQDTLGKWSAYCWEQFYTTQWIFLGLEFKSDVFDYTLDEKIILPIRLCDGHGEGSFGEVSEGELNQEHAKESEKSSRPRHVAIKLFKNFIENDHQGLAARNAWEMESQNLRELSKRNHPHLIHRIATVTHGKRFLILSDWANGGDLKTFWEQNPKPFVDPTLVREVVAQLTGLASAIELMHHGYHTGPLPRNVSHYPLTPTHAPPVIISPDPEANRVAEIGAPVDDSNWRHGDLKPENILRFLETGQMVGTLRISDLGLAKRHVEATGIRKHASSSQFGTRAYEPPEAVTRLLAPRSRLYDIWSFGCVMLEFVVWLLYGHKGLDEFWHLPVQSDETLFWSKVPGDSGPGAEVNRTVAQIMDNILATNAACRSPSAIGDLLLLIKNRVLVPALPGVHNTIAPQHQRVHADVLSKQLKNIEKKSKSREYCCPGRPEHDARLPVPSRPVLRNMPDSLHPPVVTYGKELGNLQVPSSAARAQRLNRDDWVFHSDDKFIHNIFSSRAVARDCSLESKSADLCQRCSRAVKLLAFDFQAPADEPQKTSAQCDLCRLLVKVIRGHFTKDEIVESFWIRRKGSRLTVQQGLYTHRLLTIMQLPGNECAGLPDDIQVGLPSFCKIGGPDYSQLLLAWLRDCDSKHNECCKNTNSSKPHAEQYPTKLIAIEDTRIRLVATSELDRSEVESLRYVALSYTWGNKAVHQRYFTTKHNLKKHFTGIPTQSLPNLFVDALTITKGLGMKYLWIDALCIVQGDGGDWIDEAELMHATFSAAYCVLAATRCGGTNDRLLAERPQRPSVTSVNHGLAFSADIDDFQRDVIEGSMNKRGWVLQERALARRTIYFAENQTYWECGQGVRCETLTKMTNKQASFLGDANFPQVAQMDSKGARIRLFQILYMQYSHLEFTISTDRPIAIAGLETRLITAFDTTGGFGVFERYIGRSLLWIRAPEVTHLMRIPFGPAQCAVPSWSWMAYEGGISFLDLPFNDIDWTANDEFRSPYSATGSSNPSRGRMSSSRNTHRTELKAVARTFEAESNPSDIVWDDPGACRDKLRCVIIGRLASESGMPTQKHWVLVVRELKHGLYERVGAGSLPKDRISQGVQEIGSLVR